MTQRRTRSSGKGKASESIIDISDDSVVNSDIGSDNESFEETSDNNAGNKDLKSGNTKVNEKSNKNLEVYELDSDENEEDVANGESKTEENDEVEVEVEDDNEDDDESVEEIKSESDTEDEEYWQARRKRFFDISDNGKQDTYQRYKHLLNLNGLFRHFISKGSNNDKKIQLLLKEFDQKHKKSTKKQTGRHRKSEKEEDREMMLLEEEDMENFGDADNLDDDDDDDALDADFNVADIQNEVDIGFFKESPSYVQQGKLRDYQVQGLNWLVALHKNKLSGILADEMGLGKTLQTISFLGYLRYVAKINGPFLVIAPKSTLENWQREFAKWTPEVNTVVLQGDKEHRKDLIKNTLEKAKFDVLIASFEIVLREKNALKKFAWQYIVIDEAHRIKNEDSMLSQIIRLFYSKNRLLITGTPLQNNLHELWALLNFILPDVFENSNIFDDWFGGNKDENDEDKNSEKDQDLIVQQLHSILSPFLLRRVKIEVEKSLLPKVETNVYVGMTDMQIKWYKSLLEKDIEAVNGAVGKSEGKTRLLNIVMQLRKCCNHPYLFEGAEPGPPFTTDEHLVFNSGKMIALDKLLKKKKEQGSRVLIFSQMSRVLDILEDYCFFRDYEYCRIDGSTEHEERITAIDEYNAPDSKKFIFLLTTRAGGLGINLVTADTVVLYDSDWNPQADLQAMDRAHRIGQKKQVHVYRFVTENAIEEKVLERAAQKLRLDQLVIQQGRTKASGKETKLGSSKDELLNMIQYGAQDVFNDKSQKISVDDDIDEILRKGELKTKQLNEKYENLGLDDLQSFNGLADQSAYEWNGKNFQKKNADNTLATTWITPGVRERKRRNEVQSYSVDDYYREKLQASKSNSSNSDNPEDHIKAPKSRNMPDYQFFPHKLRELDEKELLDYKRRVKYKVTKFDIQQIELEQEKQQKIIEDGNSNRKSDNADEDDEDDDDDDDDSDLSILEDHSDSENLDEDEEDLVVLEDESVDKPLTMKQKIQIEQEKIDNAPEFTEEDAAERDQLVSEAFTNWNKRELVSLVGLMAKYGKDQYSEISKYLDNKTEEEIETYCKAFWKKYTEISGHEKYINLIESREKKMNRLRYQAELLKIKIESCKSPLHDMKIQYPPNNARKMYTSYEDSFILWKLNYHGLFSEKVYEKIRQDIITSDLFPFNWFIKTRTAQDISKRALALLGLVTKELEASENKKRDAKNVEDNVADMPVEKKPRLDTPITETTSESVATNVSIAESHTKNKVAD